MKAAGIFEDDRPLRLEKLDERITKLRALKEAAERSEKARQRKTDTRRKILVGSLILKWMGEEEDLRERVLQGLQEFLVRPSDRKVFGLKVIEPRKAIGGEHTEGAGANADDS